MGVHDFTVKSRGENSGGQKSVAVASVPALPVAEDSKDLSFSPLSISFFFFGKFIQVFPTLKLFHPPSVSVSAQRHSSVSKFLFEEVLHNKSVIPNCF